jgi:NhaP-type Na+/H+ or K+/H+ antiporter
VLRSSERGHEYHAELHSFSTQVESLLSVGLLLVFGGALVAGVLDGLTAGGVLLAILLVVAVRPACGLLALVGSGLTTLERAAIAFFGVRGFGSVYYLAYGVSATAFAATDQLWAIVWLTIALSICLHGVTATPIMRLVDRAVVRQEARRQAVRGQGAGSAGPPP